VKNGAHKTKDSESTRLISNEVPDLWKVPTPEGHRISGPFTPEEVANALNHVKAKNGIGFYFPGVQTPRQVSSKILEMLFLHLLHAPS